MLLSIAHRDVAQALSEDSVTSQALTPSGQEPAHPMLQGPHTLGRH